METNEVLLRIN